MLYLTHLLVCFVQWITLHVAVLYVYYTLYTTSCVLQYILYTRRAIIYYSAYFISFLQFVFGFIVFVLPGMSDETKELFKSFHKFAGVAIFVASIFQCCIGITEKSIFSIKYGKPLHVLLHAPVNLKCCHRIEIYRKATRVGTFEVFVPTHVASACCIWIQVLTSQMHKNWRTCCTAAVTLLLFAILWCYFLVYKYL